MTHATPPPTHAHLLREYLDEVCRELDTRRAVVTPWSVFSRRAGALPLAVGLALGLANCGGSADIHNSPNQGGSSGKGGVSGVSAGGGGTQSRAGETGSPVYGIPIYRETNCADGLDNDNNGFTDCQDPYCAGTATCHDASAGKGGQPQQLPIPYGIPIYAAPPYDPPGTAGSAGSGGAETGGAGTGGTG